jgi:hypothetical protein
MADLTRLKWLADLIYDRSQRDLAVITAQENAQRGQIAALIKNRYDAALRPQDRHDASLVAGADLRWFRWIDARLVKLNAELVKILIKKDEVLQAQRKAYGRKIALDRLCAGEVDAARKLRERRLHYDS